MSSNLIVDGIVVLRCSLCNNKVDFNMQVGESLGQFIDRIVIGLLSECPNKGLHQEIGLISR